MCSRGTKVLTFEECLQQIVESALSKRLALWLGAGISCKPPANLPLSRELKFHILERICQSDMLCHMYEERLRGHTHTDFVLGKLEEIIRARRALLTQEGKKVERINE